MTILANHYRANSYRSVIPACLAGTVANRYRGRGRVTGLIVNSGGLLAGTSVANLRSQAGGQIAIVTLDLVKASRHQDFAMVGGHRLALAHVHAGCSLALVAHARALAHMLRDIDLACLLPAHVSPKPHQENTHWLTARCVV